MKFTIAHSNFTVNLNPTWIKPTQEQFLVIFFNSNKGKMRSTLFAALILTLLAGLSWGTKQDVYGICNQYHETVKFENVEHEGNNCDAPSGGVCFSVGKRAFVPKCESGQDFGKHRFIVHIGQRQYSIWKKDSDKKLYGGDYSDISCRGTVLADYSQGNAWNIVVRRDASVYLIPKDQGCPPVPRDENRWDKPKGYWKPVQSIIGGEISLSLSVGTSSTDSKAHTTEWAQSLTLTIGSKLIFAEESVSTSISKRVATQTESSLTKSEQTTQTFTCARQENTQVTMYQWVITAGHNGKQTTVANTPNIICVSGFGAPAPKCPLGACANVGCTACLPWKEERNFFEELFLSTLDFLA